MREVDIVISGGGIAGLCAAAAFGRAGFSVICADPAPPVTDRDAPGADMRSTAFLQPARAVLEAAGIWERIAPDATPLEVMRIIDTADDGTLKAARPFRASDVSDAPFGWNFPNWLLRREILAEVTDQDGVTFCPGVATTSLLTRTGEARVGLSDGTRVRARLVVAADGRDSPMRRAAGIAVRRTGYGQKALAFSVTHPLPHENTSTEIHRSGGPFTLVPLPDREGRPASAVVWMENAARAETLAALPPDELGAIATERSCHVLGPLTLASPVALWPIISQRAERLTAERLALIAEAAHVVPPIGAQGLNMSLADLACLLKLAQESPDTLGDSAMLDRYARKRTADIALRVTGIDVLNRASQAELPVLRDLRAAGLRALHDVAPVRRALMRLGMGIR